MGTAKIVQGGLPNRVSEHFRTFSFVDRIVPGGDASRVEGSYVIPSDLAHFPSSLAAEAVGQLAAWAAMRAAGFERRPIAGLAGRIHLAAAPRPGQTLQLAAEIESLDAEAVAYRGSAMVDGTLIIRLEECVGPMIPVTELDDPTALRERFAVLCGPGSAPGAFKGLPALVLQPTEGESGVWARATFRVPASAPLFADHFPRRPVFPGSLLVQMSLELASILAAEVAPPPSGRWKLQSMMSVKLREFIPPGKELELEARLKLRTDESAMLALGVRAGEETVASGRVLLAPDVWHEAAS